MSIFSGLTNQGLEESQDRLGGYNTKPTDAYLGKIKMAYAGKSSGGAHNVTLVVNIDDADYTETIYITDKEGKNYFLNKQDNTKKVGLPGFTTVDEICFVTTEKPLSDQPTEDKIVKIYDYDQKKEVPTSVPVLVDLIGKEVVLGIVSELRNKGVKNDSTGKYEDTAETREQNVIEKVFHYPTMLTVPEIRAAVKAGKDVSTVAPAFHEAWVTKNKGVQRDRRTIKDDAGGTKSGRPGNGGAPTAGGEAKKGPSLFGK